MASAHEIDDQLAALASHLLMERQAILKAWRQAVKQDPELKSASSLTRAKFDDHIPQVLDAFAHKLPTRPRTDYAGAEQVEKGAEHGAHRWQDGYNVGEVAREWRHLHLCLLDHLEAYGQSHPDLDPTTMPMVRRQLAALCGDGVSQSVAEYARLQQATAASRVRDLEQALQQVNELQRQRAEAWREAAHDLRDSVSMVSTASALLSRNGASDDVRARSISALQGGVSSLRAMLNDLLSLARLEAGQDQRQVQSFDAGTLLSTLCENVRSVARERGLFLKVDGPASLQVDGDAVKTQRIAQNLMLNALDYTKQGGVTVAWAQLDPEHWRLCIEDTGQGMESGSAGPILRELKTITASDPAEEHEAEQDNEKRVTREAGDPPSVAARGRPALDWATRDHGEGIGLSIVKQLCELLDASLHFETSVGQGSVFRVTFPCRYESEG